MNSTPTNSELSRKLSKLSPTARQDLLQEIRHRLSMVRLAGYRPYSKQAEFHAAGVDHRERLLRAANQVGKTVAGAAEAAYHLTGKYPPWWRGRRWERPTTGWIAGVTGQSTRDNPQRMLMGRSTSIGTGMIPGDDIAGYTMARGVADLMDTVRVRHVSGGVSTFAVKSYEIGREKWQGETLDWLWLDEEPPLDIYTEGLTRTNATGGMAWMTFTPLLGMSDVVRRFLMEPSPDRHDTNMTIEDAEHISGEERARIIASYPEHERDARTKGIPTLGSGRIFPVAEDRIACDPIPVPPHWRRIGAMDFGYDHPWAAVELAHDGDADVVYVTKASRARQMTPVLAAATVKPWGDWLPWAWPRDGRRDTQEGAGIALASQFTAQGLGMLPDHAQFEDKSGSVEAGLMLMLDRMQTGRFKVFRHLSDWFEEFRLYHRKDGKVVKINDDLMCLHPDTLVVSDRGLVRIADLAGTGGRVRTVGGGWAEYRHCRMTRRDAHVVEVAFNDGSQVKCTPDHMFLTPDGWVQAVEMHGKTCHTLVSSGEREYQWCASLSSTSTHRSSTAAGTHGLAAIFAALAPSCTAVKPSAAIDMTAPGHVPGSVQEHSAPAQGAVCLRVREVGRSDVYCMEVPKTSAFAIESGLIVHNCSTRYGLMMLRFAATEPKPTSDEGYRFAGEGSWMG